MHTSSSLSINGISRRQFARTSLGAVTAAALAAKPPSYLVYLGTYTGPKSKGIYVSRFDPGSEKLDPIKLAGEVERPSWVTLHPGGRYLYAVSELGNNGREQGAISSFAVDNKSGELKFLNRVRSGGGGSCHLVVDKTGKTIAVANYGSGSVATFHLEADGKLGQQVSLRQHEGSSANPRRQRGPHAHAVVLSPDNRFLFVPDLGLDKIMIYRFDAATGAITPNDPPSAGVKPGSGPRHFAFAPKAPFAYDLNEMGSSVTAFAYDAVKGSLREVQNITTLPAGFSGENNCAEIQVDRAGKFVYASNRGDDSIAVFSIHPKQGTLTHVERVSTQGKTPRNFSLDPTGNFLLAANQDSNNLVTFKVDRKSGKLTPAGQVLEVPSCVCIEFLAAG